MALELFEKPLSRRRTTGVGTNADSSTVDLVYGVVDTSDDAEINAYVKTDIPAAYDLLTRLSWRLEPTERADLWELVVTYGVGPRTRLRISTKGGTQHITFSLGTPKKYAVSETGNDATPADFKGSIGVNDDSVDGCDVVVPVFNFTVTRTVNWETLALTTPTYAQTLYRMTGRTNNAACTLNHRGLSLTFQPGELLYLGADVEEQGDDWVFGIDFAALPNITNSATDALRLRVGGPRDGSFDGGIPADGSWIEKKGHEYLWVRYRRSTSNNVMTREPQAVYVETVYRDDDFGNLLVFS